jgi:hypothetical protein
MIPLPTVVGLHVCHDVSIDLSHEVTMTRVFRDFTTPLHPKTTHPFRAFAAIYGPLGRGSLQVTISTLDRPEVVYDFRHTIEFKDRLSPVYLNLNMSYCRFPRAGGYEMMLIVDNDVIAQRVFFVIAEGIEHGN